MDTIFIKIIRNQEDGLQDIPFIKNKYDHEIIDNNYNILQDTLYNIIESNNTKRIVTISNTHVLYKVPNTRTIFISNKTVSEFCNKEMCVSDEIRITGKDFVFEKILESEKKLDIFFKNYAKDYNMHIILDYEYLSNPYINNIINALFSIREKILFLDIINIKSKEYKDYIQIVISRLCDIKEKKINIFNEYSELCIYRPEEQEEEADVGWYLLRGIDLDFRNKIMEKLIDDNKTIINITICNKKYLISKTSMHYQNNFTYFDNSVKIKDLVLFPEEKKLLCFELIN